MKNNLFYFILLLTIQTTYTHNNYQSIWADKSPAELEEILYQIKHQPPYLI